MEVSEKLEKMILAEIIRLSRGIRDDKAPINGIKLMGMLIEMLAAILTGRLTTDDMLEVIEKEHPQVIEYYVEFFKVSADA